MGARKVIDWADYANFTEAEMRCHCGCGRAEMDPDFMERLQVIRDGFCHPMPISSGFRCVSFDKQIRGAGVHPSGQAADIRVSGEQVYHLLGLVLTIDMRGIGLMQHGPHIQRFMHVDTTYGPTRPRVWTYSKGG